MGRIEENRRCIIPERLGPFEITALVGTGRRTTAYLARHDTLPSPWLLRELKSGWEPKALARDATSSNAFGGAPPIEEPTEIEGRWMSRCRPILGESLATIFDAFANKGVPPSFEVALHIGVGVAAKLGTRRVPRVHGDLAPHHILVGYDGDVHLIDPADPRDQEDRRRAPGRELYRSPEHVRNTALNPASDIFVLGVLLCELLTGQPAFASAEDLAKGNVRTPPADACGPYPIELQVLLRRMLTQERDDRIADAAEVAGSIEALIQRSSAASVRLGKWLRQTFEDGVETWRQLVASTEPGATGPERVRAPKTRSETLVDPNASPLSLMADLELPGLSGTDPLPELPIGSQLPMNPKELARDLILDLGEPSSVPTEQMPKAAEPAPEPPPEIEAEIEVEVDVVSEAEAIEPEPVSDAELEAPPLPAPRPLADLKALAVEMESARPGMLDTQRPDASKQKILPHEIGARVDTSDELFMAVSDLRKDPPPAEQKEIEIDELPPLAADLESNPFAANSSLENEPRDTEEMIVPDDARDDASPQPKPGIPASSTFITRDRKQPRRGQEPSDVAAMVIPVEGAPSVPELPAQPAPQGKSNAFMWVLTIVILAALGTGSFFFARSLSEPDGRGSSGQEPVSAQAGGANQETPTAPPEPVEDPDAGQHQVPDAEPEEEVAEEEPPAGEPDLQPPTETRITVSARPRRARILVDGKRVKNGSEIVIGEKKRRIKIVARGCRTHRQTLLPGHTEAIDIELSCKRRRPRKKRSKPNPPPALEAPAAEDTPREGGSVRGGSTPPPEVVVPPITAPPSTADDESDAAPEPDSKPQPDSESEPAPEASPEPSDPPVDPAPE